MRPSLSQHRQELSSGFVVERLPLGYAAGRWWATFAAAIPGWEGPDPDVDWQALLQAATVHDPEGRLQRVRGGGGGNAALAAHTWELVDEGAISAHVVYVDAEREIAREVIALDPTDRTGCFTTRMPDGSLLDRLPVGRAHGAWHLSWVHSDLPRRRAGSWWELERRVRLRSAGATVAPLAGSWSEGHPVASFAVSLPDTLDHLEVDYLHDGEVVATEALVLP